MVFWSIWWAWY